jgi:hypothetical protein
MSPLRDLIPNHVTPERLYLEARWSLVPYAAATGLLAGVLPIASGANATMPREHTLRVTERVETDLEEERSCFIDGRPVELGPIAHPGRPNRGRSRWRLCAKLRRSQDQFRGHRRSVGTRRP